MKEEEVVLAPEVPEAVVKFIVVGQKGNAVFQIAEKPFTNPVVYEDLPSAYEALESLIYAKNNPGVKDRRAIMLSGDNVGYQYIEITEVKHWNVRKVEM